MSAAVSSAGPAYQRVIVAWLPHARTMRALKALLGLRASVPIATSRSRRLACQAPTAPLPTALPRAPPTAAICSRPRVSEHAAAAIYPHPTRR
jgi:hypothetical protein